ncbi:tRNA threonylcarbamoyladenosine dehydratase [Thermochromatium tepidum]|uniref:tRNA cyclic N6-threonylcarbamoyladenosine(37) synthase TcdA n=1 Tax=Thermochromatium tepidum ATCC 43061 TaxID=316276 RepID=A0A6I6E296_THETI|nr:tRNA threonylcarbamoyladenosine dehydratase [Thermochromatium tepidum]QGU33055.1 tRNA cyclic N6-threonylcarbamoyladenosine(37) synthase TcdA [Thermochromatium tepidum ATCC 43061]
MPNPLHPECPSDHRRRFSGPTRLYGKDGQARLAAAHVCVVGIGGVGSWAAEALARSGVGRLTLIDLDHVAESNINRQVQAADSTLGQAKVEAMRARIASYAPDCVTTLIDDFLTPENAAEYLDNDLDYVIDAIDSVSAKVAMIALCHRAGIPLVTCGAAGGKTDPTRIRVDDLARTIQDPLLARVRAQLRKRHGFTRAPNKRFGVAAVYSIEPVQTLAAGMICDTSRSGSSGLNCAGFGSVVTVTASLGLFAAARAINALVKRPSHARGI